MKRALLLTFLFSAAACADPEKARLKATTTATYDKQTGRLRELTSDGNRNGRIDTWTEMDGPRPLRSRIDRDEDGTIDRWEYYDTAGQVAKVGYSRLNNGRPDAWAFADSNGKVARVEISSTSDEHKIDRWEHYDTAATPSPDGTGVLRRAEEDTDGDGRVDKWEIYEAGVIGTAAFDENGDGRPDRRLTYRGSALVLIESEPDASGTFTRRVDVK
jgi:hypothetical protein